MHKKLLAGCMSLFCLAFVCIPQTASAATTADKIRDYVSVQDDSAPESGTTDEPAPRQTANTETNREEDIDALANDIDALLNTTDPTTEQINDLKIRIDAIPVAERIKIPRLAEFQALANTNDTPAIKPETNENKADSKTVSESNEYTLALDENHSVTLVVRYTEDADGDGRFDVPELTVTSPTGDIYEIHGDMPKGMKGAITATESFIQFDISSASAGNWTFASSVNVMFNRMDYQGATALIEEESQESQEETLTIREETEEQGRSASSPLLLLIPLLGIVAVLILPKILNKQKTAQPNPQERQKPKVVTPADAAQKRKEEEEEEIRKIRLEMEASRRQAEEMDRENERRIREEEEARRAVADPNDMYLMTQQDIDNDGAGMELEEYDEFGTDFLARINQNNQTDE